MGKEHIIMLSRALPFHSTGGMEIASWDLAKQFAADGNRVTFLTTRITGKPISFVEDDVEVVALDTPGGRYSRSWWRLSRDYFQQHLMKSATAVFSISAGAYGLLSLKNELPQVPFIMQLHGSWKGEILSKWRTMDPKMWLYSFYMMVLFIRDFRRYPQFDALVAVGAAVREDLQHPPASWLLDQERIKLIANGVDTTLFCPDNKIRKQLRESFGWKEETKVLLSVSRLHKQKGVDLGLRGYARYAELNHDSRYIVVGDGPERRHLEDLANSLGIADKVIFSGMVSRDEAAKYYKASDLFLFTTTHSEGLPLNYLEALACGLPVVVSKHIWENCKVDSVKGVSPHKAEDICKAIQDSLEENNGLQTYLPERHTLPYCADQYLHLIRDTRVLANKKGSMLEK